MLATGSSREQTALAFHTEPEDLDRQLEQAANAGTNPMELLAAGKDILRQLTVDRGYLNLAVFGSVARGDARDDSDIDLLVQPPPHTGLYAFAQLADLLESIIGCSVDLISYGGLKSGSHGTILRDAVKL